MATDSLIEIRIGAPGSVLAVDVGRVSVDLPRSVGYFGGLAVAVSVGIVEVPLTGPVHRRSPGFQGLDRQCPAAAGTDCRRSVRGSGEARRVATPTEWCNSRTNSAEPKVIKIVPRAHASQSTANNHGPVRGGRGQGAHTAMADR
jgi:hypothetical protein